MNQADPSIAPPSSSGPSEASKRLLPWLVAVAFFMESLDTTILNTAVPAISSALGVAPLSMKAVLASYTLSLAVFIPISGWMADRFGTRRVFASAIGLFTLGSFLCGISTNIHWLVAFRDPARLRRSDDGAGGPAHPGANICQVRSFAHHELCFHTSPGGAHARTPRRRSHRWVFSLARHFLPQYSNWTRGLDPRVSAFAGLPRSSTPLRSMLSGSSSSVLGSHCFLMCWRYSASTL